MCYDHILCHLQCVIHGPYLSYASTLPLMITHMHEWKMDLDPLWQLAIGYSIVEAHPKGLYGI